MAHINECDHVGLDPTVIERFERRITKLLADMDKYKLTLFCGSGGSIRYNDYENDRQLIVGDFLGGNHDGGDGATSPDENGLLRGE
jgi:hypothetical protein